LFVARSGDLDIAKLVSKLKVFWGEDLGKAFEKKGW